jgi:hypothetical protein
MNLSTLNWLREGGFDLLVESFSSASLVVQIRGYTENEVVSHDHTPSTDRTLSSSVISITGSPIYLTARSSVSGIKRGQCYVRVSLRIEGVIVATLFAGYVDGTTAVAFPNGKIEDSLSGFGFFRSITGTDPAAGAEVSETVPTGALWKLHSLTVTLVCDATVANRQPKLRFDDLSNFVFYGGFGANSVAGETSQLAWAAVGAVAASSYSGRLNQLPFDFKLLAGYRIRTNTSTIQAGDDYGAPQLYVEEWINP